MCDSNNELVVDAPSTVSFNCIYDNPLGDTVYSWYLDDALQSGFASSTADIPLTPGLHTVRCDARISDPSSADCVCENTKLLTVAAVGKCHTGHMNFFSAL